MNDSRKKSIYKTISWRIIAILLSLGCAYLFVGSIVLSLEIVVTANALSVVAYYIHERIWNRYGGKEEK